MPSIKSLSKGLQVYKTIVAYDKPIYAKQLCEKLNIEKSTMSRLLKTLLDEGFISYLENSHTLIATPIHAKAEKKTKIELIVQKTTTLLNEIHTQTNECAYLGIFDNYKVLYLNQVDNSNRIIKTRNNIGLQAPLHTNALGKSILAFGNYDIEKIKLNPYTANTITDIKKLKKSLNEVRENGYAIDDKEYQDAMRCVAVPLFNHENILIASVGISGTKERLTLEKSKEFGKILSDIVNGYTIVV
ncbi:MAG: IclR family transcriptional regulator [Candidatus Marinarcus sp.]|uniref:IclR family transcriptional regulator n=1 Tax=Candidatus Marinarcus sp. TaxID=3100987 RepID=UPI003AFF63BE